MASRVRHEQGPVRAAVFIDADNILIPARDAGLSNPVSELMFYVRRHVEDHGAIISARSYGDWTQSPGRDYLDEFRERCIETILLPSDTRGKNTADVQLAVDAMEMVLSPSPPTVVVLASGDRDFVPLVQKIRRYAVEVWGVGIQGCVRKELREACTRFVYLDALVESALDQDPTPAGAPSPVLTATLAAPEVGKLPVADQAPEPEEVRPELDRPTVFRTMVEAVRHQIESGVEALGSRTLELMRKQLPGLCLADLGFENLRTLAEAAQREGLISVSVPEHGFGEMRLGLPRTRSAAGASYYQDPADHYRDILLRQKKVPLVTWPERSRLVRHLWTVLETSSRGLSLVDMGDVLKEYAFDNDLRLPDRALEKIVHTLNIARCFEHEGRSDYFEDMQMIRLKAKKGLSAEGALNAMNRVYVQGLRWAEPDLPLSPSAIARLLFDDEADAHLREAQNLVEAVGGPIEGEGPIGQKLREMGFRPTV